MSAIAGSIKEVTFRGRIFPVAADAEANRKIGGFENEMLANGDGSARLIKTRVPLLLDGLTLEVDDSRGDHEFLQDAADSPELFALSITYASDITYNGTAQITGEFQASSQSATIPVTFSGPGKLTRQ
jgi:hypothetical protein